MLAWAAPPPACGEEAPHPALRGWAAPPGLPACLAREAALEKHSKKEERWAANAYAKQRGKVHRLRLRVDVLADEQKKWRELADNYRRVFVGDRARPHAAEELWVMEVEHNKARALRHAQLVLLGMESEALQDAQDAQVRAARRRTVLGLLLGERAAARARAARAADAQFARIARFQRDRFALERARLGAASCKHYQRWGELEQRVARGEDREREEEGRLHGLEEAWRAVVARHVAAVDAEEKLVEVRVRRQEDVTAQHGVETKLQAQCIALKKKQADAAMQREFDKAEKLRAEEALVRARMKAPRAKRASLRARRDAAFAEEEAAREAGVDLRFDPATNMLTATLKESLQAKAKERSSPAKKAARSAKKKRQQQTAAAAACDADDGASASSADSFAARTPAEIRARGTAMLKLAPTEVRESWAHFLAAADEILEKI